MKLSYFVIKIYYFKFLIKMYFKILSVNFAYYFFFFFELVIERFALVSVLVFDKFFICLF